MKETTLAALRAWLAAAPPLAGVEDIRLDHTAGTAPQAGLAPQGVQVLGRRANVLGETTLRCRCRLTLRLVLPFVPGDDALAAANARRLLALRQWVAQQSAAHTAPAFGDAPGTETLSAVGGRLESVPNAGSEGTAVYGITLTAEYDEIYPAG